MNKKDVLHEFGFRINNGSVIGGNNWPIDRLNAMADEIANLRKRQDTDIQLLEDVAKAIFDRAEQYSVDTYKWKGYTARLWDKQFPDVTDYWVMLAQAALRGYYARSK